jgi:hypothetical protein
MAAMETQEPDDLTDCEDVADRRARAEAMLGQIARDAKEALADQGIDIDLFLLAPNSGEAILIYGTAGNPPDDEWNRVGEIVGSIVAQSIGLDRVQSRPVTCAATASIADHQPTESPAQPSEPSGCRRAPVPAPALQHVADR